MFHIYKYISTILKGQNRPNIKFFCVTIEKDQIRKVKKAPAAAFLFSGFCIVQALSIPPCSYIGHSEAHEGRGFPSTASPSSSSPSLISPSSSTSLQPYQSWHWACRCPSQRSHSLCPPSQASQSAPDPLLRWSSSWWKLTWIRRRRRWWW